jgi:hypothetical protein
MFVTIKLLLGGNLGGPLLLLSEEEKELLPCAFLPKLPSPSIRRVFEHPSTQQHKAIIHANIVE